MKPQQHAEATPVMLDRTIGFLYGIFMQVGMIIGSGIFISPSGVLRHAGSVGWALMVWLACGFLSLLGALSYAELGTTIRQSGSHYIYLRETLGTLPAFLFLWVEFIIVRPSVMAVVFLSMGQYSLEALYSPCAVPRIAVKLLAMVSICESSAFVVWVNTWSSTLSLRVQSCLSVSKLAALASIIGVGIAHVARASRLPRRADRIFRERLRHRRQPPGRSAAGVLLGDVRLFGVGFPELCHGGGEAPRTHDSGGDLRLAGHRDRRLPPRQRRLLRRAHPVADPRLRCRGPDIRRKHPGQCVLDHRASLRGPVLPRRQHGLVLYITQGVHGGVAAAPLAEHLQDDPREEADPLPGHASAAATAALLDVVGGRARADQLLQRPPVVLRRPRVARPRAPASPAARSSAPVQGAPGGARALLVLLPRHRRLLRLLLPRQPGHGRPHHAQRRARLRRLPHGPRTARVAGVRPAPRRVDHSGAAVTHGGRTAGGDQLLISTDPGAKHQHEISNETDKHEPVLGGNY
ncbi:uncharacterized protein LOC116945797 isoform X3 [Petromyzon marinus]|uniref:uncharacterized protein LOC116945797 isoform X3 n=1 Tax=Petromyzon marinus TaxID=7757 RepID=UPI003F717E91